jgi:hypothetical protein
MSIKIVKRTRTWFNATRNEWVTKDYEYELKKVDGRYTTAGTHKTAGRLLIVGKGGVYESRLKELLSTTEDPAVRSDIMAKVKEAERKGQSLSTRSLVSKISESRIEKFFINAGYSEADIMKLLGIKPADWDKSRSIIYDEANWDKSTFVWKGVKYKLHFQHKYTGDVLEVIE